MTHRHRKCPERRGLLPACAVALMLTTVAPAAGEVTKARFSVQAVGIKVGELHLEGEIVAEGYTARARFATTGLAGTMAPVRFDMAAYGSGRFAPSGYREDIDTGTRQSTAQLAYSGGVPQLAGGRLGKQDPPAVAPKNLRGTVDPMTALFAVLRDRPADGFCDIDMAVFDGARLTRILLADAGNGECSGWFTRVAGYSTRELARFGRFRVRLFHGGHEGLMQVERVQVQTVHGPVTLLRR